LRLNELIKGDKKFGEFTAAQALTFARFEEKASAAVEAKERAIGRKLTGEEMQTEIDEVIGSEITVKRTTFGLDILAFDKKKRIIELDDDEKRKAFVDPNNRSQVEQSDVDHVKNMLRSNGVQITDDRLGRALGALKVKDAEITPDGNKKSSSLVDGFNERQGFQNNLLDNSLKEGAEKDQGRSERILNMQGKTGLPPDFLEKNLYTI